MFKICLCIKAKPLKNNRTIIGSLYMFMLKQLYMFMFKYLYVHVFKIAN